MRIKLEQLAEDVALLKQITGIENHWLTPAQAAKCTPWSKEQILRQIDIAECKRRSGKKFDLIYGEHYLSTTETHAVKNGKIVDTGKTRPNYKIHLPKFHEVVIKPEEERMY